MTTASASATQSAAGLSVHPPSPSVSARVQCVCLLHLDTTVSCAETAGRIEMPLALFISRALSAFCLLCATRPGSQSCPWVAHGLTQNCRWVALTHGLRWVGLTRGLDWIAIFHFLTGWVMFTIAKVQKKFEKNHVNALKAPLDNILFAPSMHINLILRPI